MPIYDALSKIVTQNKHKGEIGLEIETETIAPYDIPKFALWDSHRDDGSLRDFGVEYIFKRPLLFEKEVPMALKEFTLKTKDVPFKKDSFTTSVHVHMNIQNDTFQTLGNFLTIYSLVENLLVRFSGPDRLSNTFCLPLCDAEETFNNIIVMCKNIEKKNFHGLSFHADSTKYGALNLSSIQRFGSLEIRLFRGETDTNKVLEWITLLYKIMEYSRLKTMNPMKFINTWEKGGSALLDTVFGDHRKLLKMKDDEDLLDENFWYAISIAQSVKDWTKMEIDPRPKKLSVKDLDKWAQKVFAKTFDNLSEAEKKVLTRFIKDSDHQFPVDEGNLQPNVGVRDDLVFQGRTTPGQTMAAAARRPIPTGTRTTFDDFIPEQVQPAPVDNWNIEDEDE